MTTTMKPPRRHILPAWWRHLPEADKDGVKDKLTSVAWAIAFAAFTPPSYAGVLDVFNTLGFLSGVAIGAAIGIIGRVKHDIGIELLGIIAMVVGYGYYVAIQALFLFAGTTMRVPLMFLAFFPLRHYYGRGKYLWLKYLANRYHDGNPVRLFGRVLKGGAAL